ncbi:leukotoxin LktA family filamentous adhesin [Bradyrhizobium manausense]|nr:leukotoxin LktA family filamentous adhesin [Bradyrhizobium manausense]
MLQGLARFRSMSLLCAMQMVFLPVFSIRLQAQTANVIAPDGRTGTSLQTSGSVTNVTTSTVSGANAFNSFSQFSVGQGNTVNLRLPTGTKNLVNIVRDAPVYVNGTLNSYMNGAIGGNVYFADPKGFVVGRSGTVNVGSLNVSTPTREFTDSLIGPNGAINGTAVGNLMAGSFPVSPDGNVRIYGRINAIDGVRLTGQNVLVGGASQRDIANLDHAAKFAASVNSKGLRSASAITVSNGSIHIGAVKNATINGRLTARSRTTTPSNVTVTAGNNIEVGKNAKLTAASKTGDAGNIHLKAARNLTVAGGASFDVSSQTGNAGLVDFSANGIIDVGSGISINLAAPNGKAGTMLMDPTDVTVGDASQGDTGVTLSNTSIANTISGMTGGASATYLIQADNSITLAAHAVVDTRHLDGSGHSTGAANNIALQAQTITIQHGAQLLAQAVNAATTYTDGNVTINNGGSAATTVTIDGKIAAGTVTVQASNLVALTAHALIDTRALDSNGHSYRDAHDVSISAPTITMDYGAQILAQASSGSTYHSGAVTLTATASDIKVSGQATASTGITINGAITGGAISIGASSTATSSFTSSIAGDFALVGATLAASVLGINGGYIAASATAVVNINGQANINGTGDVTISAHGSERAEDPAIASSLLGSLTPLGAAAVVGKINGTVTTNVASNATISAGRNLAIKAVNDATLNVSAVSASTSAQFVPTVAYSTGSVSTTANVATGASLSAGTVNASGNTLKLTAINNNSFSTGATSIALSSPTSSGGVGGAIAISDVTTSATATLGASLGTSASSRLNSSVVVEATSNTTSNSTMASTIVGTPALVNAIQEFAVSTASPGSIIADHMAGLMPLSFNLKFAAALSLANTTENATAAIAQNPSGGAPSIYASGNVAVVSNLVDQGVHSNATSSAITSDAAAGEGTAISASVAWGNFTHNSNAYIGGGTLINAADIAVDANTSMPITNSWLKWDGLAQVLGHLNGNLGVGGSILTSYANATADAGDTIGIAGSVNHFVVNNNTTAWVAGGASLTTTCTAACGSSWSATMDNNDVHTYDASLQIAAATTTASIDAAGNVGTLGFLPGNTSGGSSIGGSLNFAQFNTNTIAGVSDRATLRASNDIAVNAITSDQFVAVAPSSGKASGALALNGITSLGFLNNTTHASISNQATVRAPTVSLLAQQDLSVVSISGAVTVGGGSAVGVSVAYMGANADTAAYVGDNHADIRPGVFSAYDPFAGTSGGSGSLIVDNLSVSATTSGRITVAAVAAAISEPSLSNFAGKASAVGDAATGGAGGIAAGAAKIQQSSGASPEGFSIDLAGSSSVSDVSLATSAYILNAQLDRFTTTGAIAASTVVQALNDTRLNNGSGSAAANLAGSDGGASVALGAAIASATSNNATLAYMSGVTSNNQSSVTVQALNGGAETVVALGVSGSKGNSAALSASIGIITDSANAYIANSTITGASSGVNRALEVDAYQTSDIAIGGGALYVSGGKVGIGLTMVYASISDPTGGKATDAHIRQTSISNYDSLLVLADDASVIVAGAASGGLATNGNALAGAIVVDEISPTTTAYINSGSTVTISVGGVTVQADSGRVRPLDTALDDLVMKSNSNQLATDTCTTLSGRENCVDFGAAALNGGTRIGSGASIISVAGVIQAAKNDIGASLVYDTIATTHSAYIANVILAGATVNGYVNVSATDSSKIQSVALGIGGSSGQFAGVGAMTISSITNTVSAGIGDASSTTSNSSVTGFNISATAADNSSITGSAAVAAIAPGGGSAGGLALVYSDIGNNVNAGVTGSKLRATGTVAVNASSNASISTVAVGIAISSQVGLAGSVATNLMGTNVTASITDSAALGTVDGSDVRANNNVGVIAGNTDNVVVSAGALSISKGPAGGAGSMVTNRITGSTSAYISGPNTSVDAFGTDSTDTLSVNSGTLANASNLSGFQRPTDNTPDLTETQETVKGLAVVASSHQAVVTNVMTIAAGSGISVMVNPITSVLSGSTNAYISGASIDTHLTSAGLLPQIDVAASSFSYSGAFGAGIIPPTGNGGGGATVISTTMLRTTMATITNSTVGSVSSTTTPTVGAVTVKANAEQDASSIGVGFNTGSVALNVFTATTEAYVDGGGMTASSLTVKALDTTGIYSAGGSAAYGGQAAAAGAFLVQVSANRTEAYVGDEFAYHGGTAQHGTALTLSGALDVEANTVDRFQAYSVGGSLSTGTAAVAGMANIEIANNTTIAGVYDLVPQSPSIGTMGTVTINANEDVAIKEIAGALSIAASGSGVGFGAAANVIIFKSQTTAESINSDLNSSGAINVTALSTKEVQSYAVTAGIGGSIGIGATVGVILIGSNTADSATQQQEIGQLDQRDSNGNNHGTITAVNSSTNAAPNSNCTQGNCPVASGTAGNPGSANVSSTYDVSTVLAGGADGISAQIAGGNITGTSVNVSATSAVATQQRLLGAGFAKNVGVGAAVGYTVVDSTVLANLNATVNAPVVTVAAAVQDANSGPYSGRTIDTESGAGAGALYFGGNAAVAVGKVSNSVTANLAGSVTGTGGTGVSVSAQDTSSEHLLAAGASVGMAAVGVSIATAERSSTVASNVAPSAAINTSVLRVGGNEGGSLSAEADAVAGGIAAGDGADASATDGTSVTAAIGAGAHVTTSASGLGTILLATSTPDISSQALGVAVGGGAVGLAFAQSRVTTTVTADVGDNAVFSGGPLSITAMASVPTDGTTAYAKALAGGGGSLIGAQGSLATASENATVSAYGGTGITLPNQDVVIAAENDSSQYAEGTGLSSGFLALGATVAQVSSSAHTYAYLGAGAITSTSNTGVLQITATGKDTNVANAIAGAGGTYAGVASVATTSSTATTNARIDGNGTDDTLYFGGLNIRAKHTTNYAASGDAYQASTAGVSGGSAQNTVTTTTTAEIGTHLIINSAGGDMDLISNDIVNQAGGGARSGSGGVFSGAAALSTSTVTQTVTTNIDAGTILSLNADPHATTAVINIEAYNTLSTTDTVTLAAAGLFAGGGAESHMTANATLTVNINARELFSAGTIDIGSASRMSANNNANASLYGAIAGVGASTNAWVHATQAVNVGSGAMLQAWGDINVSAGLAGDGSVYSSIEATATTVVYNNTAVPISVLYRGTANADDDASLTLGIGSRVLGVKDVNLGASPGQVAATGLGSNYNPYLSIFGAKNSDNHSNTNNGGTGTVALNGLVVAGINNDEIITIALGSSTPTLTTSSPYNTMTLEQVADVGHFNPTMSWNHQTIQYTIVGGFNPYQQIVSQLASLSGLTTTQVQTALAATHPAITYSGSDPTGDIQRQINALIQQAPFATNVAGNSFAFNDILVSAGNVSILAQKLTGAGGANNAAPQVIAQSSPMIKIDNQGLNFLDLSKLSITNVSGGNILYRQVDHVDPDSSSNVTFTSHNSATPIIDISASYNTRDPVSGLPSYNGQTLTQTPDIYFDGVVTNEQGLLKITNNLGNVVASQTFDAATIQMVVPNGSFTFNGGAGSIFNSNHDVADQWAGTEFKPADNDTLTAVMTAATYIGAYGAYSTGVHIASGGDHPYFYYCCASGSSGVQQTASGSTIFTARMLEMYYDGRSLYSAIFLPTGNGTPTGGGSVGSTSTLAALEGPTSQSISTAPWEKRTYDGAGVYTNSGDYQTPFNCSGCSAYFQVINIQPAAITPVTAASASNPPANAPFIVGKAIILSASVLNINGTIQSGSSSNYSVNIGNSALNAINAIKGDAATLAADRTAALHGNYVDLTPYLTRASSSDVQVSAKYDAANDQILLNSVVQGTGGYVYLNGKIISTSTQTDTQGNIVPQGNIIINGGAGTITVNNTTGVQLVTNTINTGVSASSVIEIVDQLKQQTKWYVYNPSAPGGQQVSTYVANNVTASQYTSGMLSGVSGTAGLQYSPQSNMYYQWVDTATLDRSTSATQFDYGWHYTSGNPVTGPWVRTTSLVQNVQQVSNGAPTGALQTSNYQEVVTANGSSHSGGYNTTASKCCGADGHFDWYQEIFDHLTLTLTNTVKASNPINIQFNGGGTSTVAVSSNSNIVINGPINNLQGTTTVTATGANSAITVGASANNPLISGTSVTLTAPGGIGTIGAGGAPVQVQVYGGNLTASTVDHDIAISAVGSLSINRVTVNPAVNGNAPQGSVYLAATGDINSASAYDVTTPVVIGKNIEIDSTGGAIGATLSVNGGGTAMLTANPLVIQATGTILADGSVDGGVLNSRSITGTYIVQSKGDLRLGTIASSGGPVFLEAAASDGNHASILNGLTAGGLTSAQSAHLADVWASLDLLSGNAATAAVNSYQSMVTAAYNDYFQLKNIAFTNCATACTYHPSTVGLTVLRAQVAAKLGIDPARVTTTDMQTEATERLERDQFLLGVKTAGQLSDSLTTLFGGTLAANLFTNLFQGVSDANQQRMPTNAALQTALNSYNANYSYTLASTERLYSMITAGSQWTQSQLAYTVSSSAVGAPPPPIDDTVVPNIRASQVMLYTPNGSVGQLAAPQTFNFTSVNASSLTAAQKGLLASAGPGQLVVSSSTDPASGVVTYNVTLSQQSLVILDNPTAVSAKAAAEIYLGSKNNLVLGGIAAASYNPIAAAQANGIQVTGTGDVKLDAVGSITAGVTGVPVISGDIPNLTLIAEHGNLGGAGTAGGDPAANANAIQIAFASPTADHLDQVSSGQGIYVKQTTGDLVLGNISASGTIQLAATGSIYAESAFTDRTAKHIVGSDLDLRAGGAISFNGSTFQPLQVQISGAVTGSAVGDLSLLAVTGDLTVGATGTYGTLSAGGALTLNVPIGALTINADVSSVGLMQLLASRAVTIGAGTSATPTAVASSQGGLTLASATLSMGAYSAIDAAGVISVTTTGNATIGQLNSSLSYAAASNAPSIVVTAGGVASLGAIIDNGDGQTKFVASGAGAEVSLGASNGIGSATDRLTLSAALLSASTSAGGIDLRTLTDTEATLLSAVKGSVDILGTGGLTLDQVAAGTATGARGSFSAVTANGSIVIGTATSSGSQTIQASQNVTFNALATTGVAGDVGNVNVTADNGFILAQTVISGGVTTLGSLSAHGLAALVAGGAISGNTLAATTGSGRLTAGGPINWNTLNVATTLGATASQGSITFQTAQSGGTQTIHAHDNVTFNALTATGITGDAGSINVTADNGFILAQTVISGGATTLGAVSANGSATLVAATTITGNALAATTGSGLLTAAGPINWSTLNVATTLGATASQGSITFKTAQSGGTQTIHAHDNVTFNALTATGITGDAGSISVTADNGYILAQTVTSGGAPTLGSLSANGSATLIAALTNTGHNLTAATGNALLRGTVVNWDNLNVGGALGITATTGGITLGTAVSGGTQNLHAVSDIVFAQLTTTGIPGDAGDINLTSTAGSLHGGSISANGDTHFDTAGSISLDRIRGSTIKLSSRGDLTIGFISVVKELDLAASTINVKGEQIRSNPPVPLIMNVTGYNGGTATSANVSIDPLAIIVNQFNVVDASFLTDAQAVSILNGYVPGQLILTTATEQVLLNNRSPAPTNWPALQLYQPGGVFTMSQTGNANVSNAYVVFYSGDMSATVTNYGATHTCCNAYTGASMMRNVAVDGEGYENIDTWLAQKSGGTFYQLGVSGHARLDALLSPRPVETIGSGPAVNIEGLSDMRKLRRHGQRILRPGWKDAAVGVMTKPATSRLAEAW